MSAKRDWDKDHKRQLIAQSRVRTKKPTLSNFDAECCWHPDPNEPVLAPKQQARKDLETTYEAKRLAKRLKRANRKRQPKKITRSQWFAGARPATSTQGGRH